MCGAPLATGPASWPPGLRFECDVCGVFGISTELHADGNPLRPRERYRLSHWIKQRSLNGQDAPRFITQTEVREVLDSLPTYDTTEKPDLLLASLCAATPIPGRSFTSDPARSYSMACARDKEEFHFYFLGLLSAGLIRELGLSNFEITQAGWVRLRDLRTQPHQSRNAFVAMRFIQEMRDIYGNAIKPAIEAGGYSPALADTPAHNERIDAHIMVQIKTARFMVADVTHENAGVYFEAGYAVGLGRPVIWTCKEEEHKKVHFDTRQYSLVLWNDERELFERLRDRIIATI